MCRIGCGILFACLALSAQTAPILTPTGLADRVSERNQLLEAHSAEPADPQSVARLTPALLSALESNGKPEDAVEQTLVNAMMSIAVKDRLPTRQEVGDLAEALRGVLAGRKVDNEPGSLLSRCIVNALRGERTSNFTLAADVRFALTALRVTDQKADLIVRRFMAIGEAVRGPDDLPASEQLEHAAPLK